MIREAERSVAESTAWSMHAFGCKRGVQQRSDSINFAVGQEQISFFFVASEGMKPINPLLLVRWIGVGTERGIAW